MGKDSNLTFLNPSWTCIILFPFFGLYLHKKLSMQFLVYIIVFPILWIISILPFRVFYWFSDLVYIIVYRIVGYRKKTVRANIALALPYLSQQERIAIEKKFYHHLCDLFLEMVKTLSISKEEMDKRFKITNIELVKEFEKKEKALRY